MSDAEHRADLLSRIAELSSLAQESEDLKLFNPESSRYQIRQFQTVAGVERADLDSLGRDLAIHLGFDPDGHINMRKSPNGAGRSEQSISLGLYLVAHARVKGAEVALTDFEQFVANNRMTLNVVYAVWGLSPTNKFEIYDGIYFGPLSEVPKSELRDTLLGVPTYVDQKNDSTGLQVRAQPRAALSFDLEYGPVLSATGQGFPPSTPGALRDEDMLDIVLCLTLLSNRAVAHIAATAVAPADTPLLGGIGGIGGQAVMWEHGFPVEPEVIDEESARRIVSDFFKFRTKQLPQIRTVLRRLNLAKSTSRSWEDQAIDLGIAVEALLFNPNDPTTEISSKFKMRGALLASSDPLKRKEAFKLLDQLYTMRSTAAHGGTLPYDDDSTELFKIRDGIRFATQLIERVLSLGYIPENWNALALGWDRLPPMGDDPLEEE